MSSELGTALRRWRGRVAPDTVGLPGTGQRRVAGLRREELALLAGVSADYIVRLEQGRAVNPSAQVLASLSRALRLTSAERDHLYRLAGTSAPGAGRLPTELTPGLRRLIDQLPGTPIGVFDPASTLLAWNPRWAALFGDPSARAGRERNVLWRHFTGQPSRVVHARMAEFEAASVADVRAVTARYPDDPELRRLVADLRAASPRFAQLWQAHTVGAHVADRKTIMHPELGSLTLDCDVLTVQGSDLRVIAYTAAPGSVTAGKLTLLGANATTMGSAGPRRHRDDRRGHSVSIMLK